MNKDKMREEAELFERESGMKGVSITIRYDPIIQKITGKEEDPMILSEGSLFQYVLLNVFEVYPEIQEKYPPGVLGFIRNGGDLFPSLPMQNGDVILFTVALSTTI